ncbi:MAG: hypothetical protein OXK81_04550 [Chloroflexota bacterium]|nr:hypothetical protein [Chloroflexota bacterium]
MGFIFELILIVQILGIVGAVLVGIESLVGTAMTVGVVAFVAVVVTVKAKKKVKTAKADLLRRRKEAGAAAVAMAAIRAEQQAEEERLAEEKREEELLQRMKDLTDLMWTRTPEQGMERFGLKSIEEAARELGKAVSDASPKMTEQLNAWNKEREKQRYEERIEAERQEKLQADLWQGTGGVPKPSANWIRNTWSDETKVFTPWLSRHLELVSACTGLDLCLEGREVEIPMSGRADIVARDNRSKSKVVIENQLEAADFGHMQRLSAYGDGLNASVRIWIAASFSSKYCRDVRKRNRQSELPSGGPTYYLLELKPHGTMPLALVVGPRNSRRRPG